MVVKIEGKEHKQGTAKKTGKDYDFIVLHFLARQNGVDGVAAIQKIMDPAVLEYDKILVNQHYDLVFGMSGEIAAIRPAKP